MPLDMSIHEVAQFPVLYEEVITLSVREVLDRAQQFIDTYFPRKTGALIESTRVYVDVAFGEVTIYIDVNVHYAGYVEAMEGVNWTNPLTIEHFVKVLKGLMLEWLMEIIQREMKKMFETMQKVKAVW